MKHTYSHRIGVVTVCLFALVSLWAYCRDGLELHVCVGRGDSQSCVGERVEFYRRSLLATRLRLLESAIFRSFGVKKDFNHLGIQAVVVGPDGATSAPSPFVGMPGFFFACFEGPLVELAWDDTCGDAVAVWDWRHGRWRTSSRFSSVSED